MAAKNENSTLKRALQSVGEGEIDVKKPRRYERLSVNEADTPLKQGQGLPSPLTHKETSEADDYPAPLDGPATPPSQFSRDHAANLLSPPKAALSSPPSDTQPFTQSQYHYEVEDEEGEAVWGYLIPLDSRFGETLVLRRRSACPAPENGTGSKTSGRDRVDRDTYKKDEAQFEKKKITGVAAGGYLIGRHPECDRVINKPSVSNRHCLIFNENKGGDTIAVLEDLSSNGTFVNDAIVGRNKRRELCDRDRIDILDEARFLFRYPRSHDSNSFRQQYSIQEQLGKGHFATVYLCIEKCTGMRYAVKKFEKRTGPGEKSKVDGLQQEIAVLMGISHPSLLCLKDTFDENDGVYLVLELAPEGELFNWIVMKQKLTEQEARKVFIQLFQAVKYLHERNIVHRDIKPENILLADKQLHVKLADFGLAKIIGEESFTTTLCGTPSYVAPEILEGSNHRRYTRAVDVWSLGVVLYICLCGFPPFSDELCTPDNPYTLSQQIKQGRFDYPSPYWDSVGDPALDLIDRMLTVDVDKRITIDECLEHPWVTQKDFGVEDSTDGLTGAMSTLDFSKRKVKRERTLLSSINDIKVSKVIELQGDVAPVKVFEKNAEHKLSSGSRKKEEKAEGRPSREMAPDDQRDPEEFIEMGGKGDQALFGEESNSKYVPDDVPRDPFIQQQERL